ncbi:MAG: OFA family MFS transporter [Planctomycetes bacterium]|nr:OFA family MFS transporter [Planctomycetota bacterium]
MSPTEQILIKPLNPVSSPTPAPGAPQTTSNKGWTVTLAGTGINLALGVLYSWSVISKKIPEDWGWNEADRALPYTIACLVFAFMMVPAGKLQDIFGPRLVASLGGLLTGLGLILAYQFNSVAMYILCFGVLAGTGIGFGYSSATPPAIKWFPPARTGLIAGIVVAGFGLASVYIAPLAQYLIGLYGVPETMLIFGVSFLVTVVILAQFLVNPPPAASVAQSGPTAPMLTNPKGPRPTNGAPRIPAGHRDAASKTGDYLIGQVLSTYQFYILWLMYAFNAGAGLMVIGKLAKVVSVQTYYEAGFILVALLAVGNAGGRILAGILSDKLGRIRTLQLFTLFQAVLMFLMPFVDSALVLVFFSIFIGMNYGSNLSVFPSITKDFFGLKNFGVNYGLVFTAWGVGSLLALVSGIVYVRTGSFQLAFFLSGALLIVSIILSFTVKKPVRAIEPARS